MTGAAYLTNPSSTRSTAPLAPGRHVSPVAGMEGAQVEGLAGDRRFEVFPRALHVDLGDGGPGQRAESAHHVGMIPSMSVLAEDHRTEEPCNMAGT